MKKPLFKMTLASILTALAIVLKIISRRLIPSDQFGIPLFALPLVLGSIMVGPIYGAVMGMITDYISMTMSPFPFSLFFFLSAVVWGLFPGLFNKLKGNKIKLLITLLITHLTVTTFNTFGKMKDISGVEITLENFRKALIIEWPRYAFSLVNITVLFIIIISSENRIVSMLDNMPIRVKENKEEEKEIGFD